MDERGEVLSTSSFAQQLQECIVAGVNLSFLIGGVKRLSSACINRADACCWSLSALTLPHMLVRHAIAGQMYHALMLLSGHPCHHE